ncbi:MAG: methionine adenosyltransferase [Proteobacteria bacterium]|nr:methionine adenosyltransferase [Pseudomonadota bacterium]
MIKIEKIDSQPVSSFDIEIVERKGLGHPDTICDLLAEEISRALSKKYISLTGRVLHHNIDKILLSAGKTEKTFGGGIFLKPIKIFVGDRATFFSGTTKINVYEIVNSSIINWFKRAIKHLDIKNIETNILLEEGSEELTGIFKDKKDFLPANDTSVGIGYYPLTPLESMTLDLENYLNSEIFKKNHPYTGEDVKVMALRFKKNTDITIAMPFISRYINNERHYFHLKEEVCKDIENFVESKRPAGKTKINLNTLDRKGDGINGIYLTLTGTSAEDADSGEVGRGNRANGLISFMRPLGSEAVAGKNPVSHIGKIYNFFAFYLAERIYRCFDNIDEIYVYILSRIGNPVNKPLCLNIKLLPRKKLSEDTYNKITLLAQKELQRIDVFCKKIISGKICLK